MAYKNLEQVHIDKKTMLYMIGVQAEFDLKYPQLTRWLEKRRGIKITPAGLRYKLTTFEKDCNF